MRCQKDMNLWPDRVELFHLLSTCGKGEIYITAQAKWMLILFLGVIARMK